jgi:hypothetical protein
MTTLTRIQIRPNATVGFYFGMPKADREALSVKYQGANPTLLQNNTFTTSDLLTFTQTLIFTTPESCAAFQAEPAVIADQNAKVAHCVAHNITAAESVV